MSSQRLVQQRTEPIPPGRSAFKTIYLPTPLHVYPLEHAWLDPPREYVAHAIMVHDTGRVDAVATTRGKAVVDPKVRATLAREMLRVLGEAAWFKS